MWVVAKPPFTWVVARGMAGYCRLWVNQIEVPAQADLGWVPVVEIGSLARASWASVGTCRKVGVVG